MKGDSLREPSRVQKLVDEMLDRAHREHPGVEFVVTVPRDQILLLPRDSTELWRPGGLGQFGYFNVHVYRDCQIEEYPAEVSTRVAVCPLVGPGPGPASTASDYIGDITSGEVTVVRYD